MKKIGLLALIFTLISCSDGGPHLVVTSAPEQDGNVTEKSPYDSTVNQAALPPSVQIDVNALPPANPAAPVNPAVNEAAGDTLPPQTVGTTTPANPTIPPVISNQPTATLTPVVPNRVGDRTISINTNRGNTGPSLPISPVTPNPQPTPVTPTPATPAVTPTQPSTPPVVSIQPSVPRGTTPVSVGNPVSVNPRTPVVVIPTRPAPVEAEEIPNNDVPDAEPAVQPGYTNNYQPNLNGTAYYVSSLGWDRRPGASSTSALNDCRSESLPCLTLNHALDRALTGSGVALLRPLPSDPVIILENGTHRLSTASYLLNRPVKIIGRTADGVILDATGQRRMFEVNSAGVEFENLTFRGANSIWQEANSRLRRANNDIVCGGTGNYGFEGNVVVVTGHATFRNVRFHENRGASLTVVRGTASLINSTIEDNYGAYVGGAMTCNVNAIMNIHQSMIRGNANESSYNPRAGDLGRPVGVAGLYNMGTMNVSESRIVENDGTQVGGIQHAGGNLTMTGVTFENNDGTFAPNFINASGVPGSVTWVP